MKKIALTFLSIVFLCATLLASCADQEEDSVPGVIETFTEETADEITTSIKKPLNKARAVKKTGRHRMKGMDGIVKK
jgi:ABC-type uncharacterized transport system substrate-binding protein